MRLIRGFLSGFLVLVLSSSAWAQLKITGELKLSPYKLVRLTAEGAKDGSALIWDVDKEEVADVEELPGRLLFTGPPGQYRIKCRAITLVNGKTNVETARTVVTIGDAPPPGPEPGPDPPPTPMPVDDFGRDLLAAWKSEVSKDKTKLTLLKELFRTSSDQVKTSSLPTVYDFYLSVNRARTVLIGDALPETRKAITSELDRTLPRTTTAPLDQAAKDLCSKEFAKVAQYLSYLN